MSESATLARPYAKAAFEYAAEHNQLDEWSTMLGLFAAVGDNDQVASALGNPGLTPQKRAELVLEVCGDQVNPAGQNLVHLLATNHRLGLFADISASFEILKAEHQKSVQVEAISAYPLDRAQVDSLAAKLEQTLDRKVDIEVSVDQTLIGGVLIRAGDKVIDGTIRGRLQRLAESMHS